MRLVESIVQSLDTYLNGKKILEVACGDSDFSLYASIYAKKVFATDISLERLKRRNLAIIPKNFSSREMDATNLDIDNGLFDITICYNALGHLESILRSVLIEMTRVTIKDGYLMFITTWKMDKIMIPELKKIISEHNNLTIHSDIENSKYSVIIVKKST